MRPSSFRSPRAPRAFCALLVVLCCVLSWTPPHAAAVEFSRFSELAEKTGPAVVNIATMRRVSPSDDLREMLPFRDDNPQMERFFDEFERFFGENFRQPGRERQERSQGSGFIITEDGLVVTNNHVVEDADEVIVNLQGPGGAEESYTAEVVGRDRETDLAVLKIEVDRPLPTLTWGDSDAMRIGEWVVAIGNPFGLDHSVTAGIVSAKGRVLGSGPYDDFIQTDASINPGNSGGPLLNLEGEVIGINTAIVASGQGIGFAIPSRMARKVIAQIKEGETVQRGWLGVSIQDVDKDVATALDLPEARGALVVNVLQGEPADKAGLEAGDVILSIEGKPVEDTASLLRVVANFPPGAQVAIEIWRRGQQETLQATLGQRDTQRLAAQEEEETPQETEPAAKADAFGLVLTPVDENAARRMDLPEPQGLLVLDVEAGSLADDAELRPDDVILEVNQKPVNDVEAFEDILRRDARDKGVALLLLVRDGRNLFRSLRVQAEPSR